MNNERTKILDLLAKGKITVSEAEELLNALGQKKSEEPETPQAIPKNPKFLKIQVESARGETVNIRVPFQLLRSGIKLASLMPSGVQDKVNHALRENGLDIDLSKIKAEDLESLVNDLAEMQVDVESKEDKVRIFCE